MKPETLLVMLYANMFTKIKQARECIEMGQYVKSKACIIRAMKIADVLIEHLNLEEGDKTTRSARERLFHHTGTIDGQS